MSKNKTNDLEFPKEKEISNERSLTTVSNAQYDSSKLQSTRVQSQLYDIEESESEMNAVGYEDLSIYSRYNIGQGGTEERGEIYQKYVKALQRRVRAKLERKSAIAAVKALQQEKAKLSFELQAVKAQKKQKQERTKSSLSLSLQTLKEQISFQSQLITALQSQLQTQSELTLLSQQVIDGYPRDKMSQYLSLMKIQSNSIKRTSLKITVQLQLQQVLLQNLQAIISELPEKTTL